MSITTTLRGFTREELSALVTYDPATGLLTTRDDTRLRIYVSRKQGYVNVRIFTKEKQHTIGSHRVIWFLVHGYIDDELQIDHINGIRSDNRIANLRLVTSAENKRNTRLQRRSKSGQIGVVPYQGKWRVMIQGKYYGDHKNLENAKLVARTIYNKLGYHENHGRIVEEAA